MNKQDRTQLIVGIGSSHGDDRIGWAVADQLLSLNSTGVRVSKAKVPLDLLNEIEAVDHLHIVDACHGDGEPGRLSRWIWPCDDSTGPTLLHNNGTHDFGVTSTLKLAEQLNQLPSRVVIWGILGSQFAPASHMSEAIACRIPEITGTILRDVRHA